MEVNDINENYGSGWIKLYRSIKKHWIFTKNKPLTKFEAWIVILMEVNHESEKYQIGYDIYDCNRGDKFYSLDTWSKMFNWDKSRTRRFFELLQKDNMICIKSVQKTTHLTVCNYDIYQSTRNANETEMKRKRNASETQMTPIKEDKELNNKRKVFIAPTIQEVIDYFEENGFDKDYANKFFKGYDIASWKDSKGNPVRNWKQKAQHVWFKEEYKKYKNGTYQKFTSTSDRTQQAARGAIESVLDRLEGNK